MQNYDVAVIGGGVVGCAIARELSRWELSVCLIERGEDVCSGTSKANSAIIHAGFDAEPGTWKAKMNVAGSRMMPELARELDFRFRRNGALVVCLNADELPALESLYRRGLENGVDGLRILSGDEARALEPNLTDGVVAALYAQTSGIVCPFDMTIALAENALENGVEFRLNECVEAVIRSEDGYALRTSKGEISARFVVNAAGVHSDELNNQVSEHKLHITPRKGDYILLDRAAGKHVSTTVFQLPGKLGKGILVTPTAHGNLLLGPTATDVEDRECASTTAAELDQVTATGALGVKNIPFNQAITSFCGLRAHEDGHDFVLGEPEDAPGFFNAAGVESPGLSSAPAIGAHIAGLVAERACAARKANFISRRKGFIHAAELSAEKRAELIRQNPLYGRIVCRCEEISEGEIVDAIRRPLGARSLDGVKRRVRAGMGRCQAGFCTPRVMEILARELDVPMESICKNVPGSELLTGRLGEVRA